MIDINELKLVSESNEILSTPLDEFDFSNPVFDPVVFAAKLHNCMIKNDGLGLSACQVGLPYRIFCMRVDGNEPYVLFNPRIVSSSYNVITMKEGCLSFPLLYLNVKRPDAVRIRYQMSNGQTNTQQFIGMSARVALHEMDHMDGITFDTRATAFESKRALRKRMILKRRVK